MSETQAATVTEPMQEMKTLVIASHPDNMTQVEEFVEKLREEFGVKEDVYANLVIAVTEAVNNSMKHGNKYDEAKSVTICAGLATPYLLRIEVSDEGDGFDPALLPDPTLPENMFKETGRGVFFINTLADFAAYHDEGRKLEMKFNI